MKLEHEKTTCRGKKKSTFDMRKLQKRNKHVYFRRWKGKMKSWYIQEEVHC